jgi:SEC-C motif-containing protein
MFTEEMCKCGSGIPSVDCCAALHAGKLSASSPLELMRSRYVAYCYCNISYLIATTLPSMRKYYPEKSLRNWAQSTKWLHLEIVAFDQSTVRFIATYLDAKGRLQQHREHSTFQCENGVWYFVDGTDF